MLSPMKNKGEEVESYGNIKTEDIEFYEKRQRTLSPAKNKGEDIESYENCQYALVPKGSTI